MMYNLILLLLAATISSQVLASKDFTIYLTRHAEKLGGKNPELTQCGNLRAKQLAAMLKNAQLRQIYSTSYKRTMATAHPSSKLNNIAIKQYAPNRLEQLAHQLKKGKITTLVVGHSNTTPELVKQLSNQQVEAIDETEYQMLYQIHFVDDKPYLTLLRQPLNCT